MKSVKHKIFIFCLLFILLQVMESLKDEIQGFQEEKDEFEAQLVKLRSVVDEKKSEVI